MNQTVGAEGQLSKVHDYTCNCDTCNCDTCNCDTCNCDICSTARRQRCMTEACDDLTASVRDCKENGGTNKIVRSKAFGLLRLMLSDLEA